MAKIPSRMTSDEVVKCYAPRMGEWLKYAYDEGYKSGFFVGKGELDKLRSKSKLEAGEHDAEYADEWRDYTAFYGWCEQCKHPISGRWAHVAKYCQWCGASFDRENEPYPAGMKDTSRQRKEILDMCADINPEEIKAHDTEESLKGWCGAWNRKMTRLLKDILEGES